VIAHVLIGWCTLHAVIYLALAVGLMWGAQYAFQVWSERTSQPVGVRPSAPSPRPDAAGSGRHRKPSEETR
jgi:hypothetical protein